MISRMDDVRFTDCWYSWFVGLTDGEGSFVIGKDNRNNRQAAYHCRFFLQLRDDDKSTIEEIRDTLGVGNIFDEPARTRGSYNQRPLTRFQVGAIKDCAELVKIFDWYPSRAKKKRDYSIWRSAVIELQKPVAHRNGDLLEYYFQEIRRVREYEKQPELEKPVIVDTQLLIEF